MNKVKALKILGLYKEPKLYSSFLKKEPTWDQIKSARKDLQKIYHTDKLTGDQAKFIEVENAYNYLKPFYNSKNTDGDNGEDKDKDKDINKIATNEPQIMNAQEMKANTDYKNALDAAENSIPQVTQTVRIICPEGRINCSKSYVGNIQSCTTNPYDFYDKMKEPMKKPDVYCYHGYGILDDVSYKYIGTFQNGKRHGIGELTDKKKNIIYKGFFHEGNIGMHVEINNGKITCKNGNNNIDDNYLQNKIKQSLEKDVENHVQNATKIKEEFESNEEKKKTEATKEFNEKITSAKKQAQDIKGYVTEKDCKYYGDVQKKNLTYVAHGLGEKTCNNGDTYFGTFHEGKFTGLGRKYINNSQTTYYGIFKDGELNGMGLHDKFFKRINANTTSEGTIYSDSFNDTDKLKNSFIKQYTFVVLYDSNLSEYILHDVAREDKTESNEVGNDYNLVQEITNKMINEVNNYLNTVNEAANAGKTKEQNDIEKDKTNQENEKTRRDKEETDKKLTKAEQQKIKDTKDKITEANNSYKNEINNMVKIPTINKHGTIVSDKGTYQGGVDNMSNPYGVGTLTFTNEDVFQGKFENGKMEFGKLTYQDKSVYQGFFKDGKPNGWGVLISSDGKTEYYSDSFDGNKYGDSLETKLKEQIDLLSNHHTSNNDSTALSKDVSQVSKEVSQVSKDLKALKEKLFGANIHLVIKIKCNIKDDVQIVVERAITETTKAQTAEKQRITDEENAKKLEKKRLEEERLEEERLDELNKKLISEYFKTHILTPNSNNNVQLFVADKKKNNTDGKNYIIVHHKSNNSEGEVGQLKAGQNILQIKQSSKITFYLEDNKMAIVNKKQVFYKNSKSQHMVINDDKAENDNTLIDVEIVLDPFDSKFVEKYEKNSADAAAGTGTSFSKVALISAATAAATAGLYYAYKKYNKSAKKSSDKRSEPKRSEPKRSHKSSEPRRSAKKRSDKKRSAKRSEKKRKRRSDISNRSAKKSSATRSERRIRRA